MGGARQHRLQGSRKFRENEKITVDVAKSASEKFLRIQTLHELHQLLNLSSDNIFKILYPKYSTFEVKKKQSIRRIQRPDYELIGIQRQLNFYLNCVYLNRILQNEFIPSYAYIPSIRNMQGNWIPRNIVTNASLHTNKRLVATLDIEDFFNSITKSQVINLFTSEPFNFPSDIADFFAKTVTFDDILPVGAPTSPVITNLIFLDIDLKIREFPNLTYSRYSDDITLSTDFYTAEELETILKSIIEIIEDYGYSINKGKKTVKKSTQRQLVTGITVNQKTNVSRKYIRNIRAILHSIQIQGWHYASEKFVAKNQKKFLNAAKRFYLTKLNWVVSNEVLEKSYESHFWYFNKSLRSSIEHIGYVKGIDDSVYKNLLRKYLYLTESNPLVNTNPELEISENNVFVTNATANSIVFYAYAFLKNCGIDDEEIKDLRSKFSIQGMDKISYKELLTSFQNQSAYFLNLYFYMSDKQRFEKFIEDMENNKAFKRVFKNYSSPLTLIKQYHRKIYHTTKDCESLHNNYDEGNKFFPNTGVFSNENEKSQQRLYVLTREFLDSLAMRKCENC